MLKGNKGEWSEIYTLLKIIADGKLYGGDENLQRIDALISPILKVIRTESDGTFEYETQQDLVIVSGNGEQVRIPLSEFQHNAALLLQHIKAAKEASFELPDIAAFARSFNCTSLKAKSSSKSDIRIIIHDERTCMSPELGFSIKSQLGSASTLLNAGRTTNFIFKITGKKLSDEQVAAINAIDTRSKIKDRLAQIQAHDAQLQFYKTENVMFANNLTLIDSRLPALLADILQVFYSSSHSTLIDLLDDITQRNPLNFDQSEQHPFYSYKITRFLTDIALGMMPATMWTGELEATGGYLVVKEDGDILAYHIYNRNFFENYLLNNTKLDTASSTKHGFGKIYSEAGEQFFKLNLQIRFKH
ncbi:MAG: HpaII family restriction endonuclease [Gallionella sp.]